VLLPLEHARVATTDGTEAPAGAPLAVDGAEVTAVTREGRTLLVRVLRARSTAGRAEIRWGGQPARGWSVDLVGRPLAAVDGGLELRPWQVATVRLAPA
jgi:hypothetical protein